MILIQGNEVGIRTLEAEDAPLLWKWLNDPDVLTYYEGRDRPQSHENIRESFYEEIGEATLCIIQFMGNDIGYLQFYPLEDEDRQPYGYGENDGIIYGMDQFIGETDYWNRGIGTKLIGEVTRYLFSFHGADKIVMDPQTWNERAIKVYEKNGFIKKRLLPRHEFHEGEHRDCWLIELDKDSCSFPA
ncbi:GNAT family N-acetyltransferase [Paenibacillus sp. CAU 1782]